MVGLVRCLRRVVGCEVGFLFWAGTGVAWCLLLVSFACTRGGTWFDDFTGGFFDVITMNMRHGMGEWGINGRKKQDTGGNWVGV